MIAADTSTWIAFLEGREGEDAQLLDQALEDRQVLMDHTAASIRPRVRLDVASQILGSDCHIV